MATEMISYGGDAGALIWKHPTEDFTNRTQLFVHEGQEAIFLLNGEALDVFGPGRHRLDPQSAPLIARAIGKLFGLEKPFHCEVYYVNKIQQMALKWGTDSRIRFTDPVLGVPLELGACGELSLTVTDGRRLLTTLVGTLTGLSWEGEDGATRPLKAALRPLISAAVKAQLANAIKEMQIDLFEIDVHLERLSEALRVHVDQALSVYGLGVPQFLISSVALPEEDANFKHLRELRTTLLKTRMAQADATVKIAEAEAEISVEEVQRRRDSARVRAEVEDELLRAQLAAEKIRLAGMAEAEVMQAKGYTQRDVLATEVQTAFAESLGKMGGTAAGGGLVSEFANLGAGMAAAGAVRAQMGAMLQGSPFGAPPQTAQPAPQPAPAQGVACAACGKTLPEGARFCLNCGTPVTPPAPKERVCPACGKAVPEGSFCPFCGQRII